MPFSWNRSEYSLFFANSYYYNTPAGLSKESG